MLPEIAFYWEPLNAIHNITITLWVGSIFYYIFGLQSCLSLLDPTQKTSLQLQSLRKLFQYSWINAILTLITQAMLFLRVSQDHFIITWSAVTALAIVIIMILLQFYSFTTAYRKARRSLRPKPAIFSKIHTFLKIIVFLGIINLVLLSI